MQLPSRCVHVVLFFLLMHAPSSGQQPAASHAPFKLNAIEQAFLDQLLDNWEQQSAQIVTFRCNFERWDYNAAFGPGMDKPFSKDSGEISFQKPDKGSFQIKEIHRWQAPPADNANQPAHGTWVHDPNILGAHWVCDGGNVYEYRHDQKQLVVRPIPRELQGNAIVDGPLPFLFGAEAAKLKQRYWIKVTEQPNPDEIWLLAYPKRQADAANYRAVEIILTRQNLLPRAMNVHLPDGNRHAYLFDLASANVNGRLDRLKSLFQAPRTPFGWKRVVEPGIAQAQSQPLPKR